MNSKKLPVVVFRGTTIDYPGNKAAQQIPSTSTSTHIVKALWFALECSNAYYDQSVIYLAYKNNFDDINCKYNCFSETEDEIGFEITPTEFYQRCEGYIHFSELQKVLKSFQIECNNVVRKENLNRICEETPKISIRKTEKIIQKILPLLKK